MVSGMMHVVVTSARQATSGVKMTVVIMMMAANKITLYV